MWLYSSVNVKLKAQSACPVQDVVKGVMTRSMVGALLELCSPLLKRGNSAFIAAIAMVFFHKPNIGHSNNYGPNRNIMGCNY